MKKNPKADQLQCSLQAACRTLDAERHDLAEIGVEHTLNLVRHCAQRADRAS